MSARTEYEKWLAASVLSEEERQELLAIRDDEIEIESRFFKPLSFGTAGLRGTMETGLHRMNVHVIRHATQAFADVITDSAGNNATVAVCFDCRNNSRLFAQETAAVFAANGLKVRIFEDMRPTPELSFAIRRYACAAGVNITASHNTKEYNGYKIYWSDGAQLPPQVASLVSDRMENIDIFSNVRRTAFGDAVADGKITFMGAETDEEYLEAVLSEITDREAIEAVADEFKIVYTPFHGTGRELVPEALRRAGFRNIYCVAEQMIPDGDFPTVESPNPELREGFALAEALANETSAHIIIGTDPDADRIAILVRENGGFTHLSGHKTGVLLIDFLLESKKRAGTLPKHPVILKTIVTTEMARRVAEAHGAEVQDTFTGFKFMAERKNELESAGRGKVLFSYEESFGYMLGDHVRDKDAVAAAVWLAEMAAWYHRRGMTLTDALDVLSEKVGYHGEETVSLVMPGLDGLRDMEKLMEILRTSPPAEIAGVEIVSFGDYSTGLTHLKNGTAKLPMSGSNLLRFERADGTAVLVRPSGTEPKIKVYIHARGATKDECEKRVEMCIKWAKSLPDMIKPL